MSGIKWKCPDCDQLLKLIRSRSRQGWRQFVLDKIASVRIWIQDHGELAAVYALVAGIVLVLAFRLLIILLALLVAAGFVVWRVAPSEDDLKRTDDISAS